jgi:hypothetical protein
LTTDSVVSAGTYGHHQNECMKKIVYDDISIYVLGYVSIRRNLLIKHVLSTFTKKGKYEKKKKSTIVHACAYARYFQGEK